MRFLIDANCVIYLFAKRFPELNRRVRETSVGDIGLSTIVFAQLAHGSMRGKPPTMIELERLVVQMPILPFDEAAALGYARSPFERGRFDRLLAGHALSLDAAIITHNTADFAGIDGLRLEDWTE